MIDLSRFKDIFKWWWLVLLSTVIAGGAGYYTSSQEPRIYETSTTLMVGQAIQKANPDGSDFFMAEQIGQAYAQMVNREPLLEATANSLELDMGWQDLSWRVSAWHNPGTQLLTVSVQDTIPERAVAIADAVAFQLILQTPTSPQNQARQERSQFVEEQLDDLQRRIQAAQAQIAELETELDNAFSARQIKDLQTQISDLQGLVNEWQKNYTNLLNFLEGTDSPNTLRVLESAVVPTSPISPDIQMNTILSAITGLMLALGAAFWLEYIDNTVKSPDDVPDLTSLGSINLVHGKDHKERLVAANDPYAPASEAYRLLRTNIQFMGSGESPKSMMITSPGLGEGKSMTAANLGVVMAQADFRTILVDADLRKPMMHEVFELPNHEGLANLLSSSEPDIKSVLRNTEIENLQVITSGPRLPNPSERLSSQRMNKLLEALEEMADVVIFDSPPVLAVADGAALANWVDGVIFVVRAKQTNRSVAKKALDRLHQIGANMLGSVLNGVAGRGSSYYAYRSTSREVTVDAGSYVSPRTRWQQPPSA